MRGPLQRPVFAYLSALALVAVAATVTYLIEHSLSRFTFHGMLGFLALLVAGMLWGLCPAALAALFNALLLNFIVVPARPTASVSALPAFAEDVLTTLLSLAFGLVVVALASLNESRRRRLVAEQEAREHAYGSEQRAHAEARKERDSLQRILDVLPEAVVIYDAEARITACNPVAAALFGASIVGQRRSELAVEVSLPEGASLPAHQLPGMRSLRAGETSRGVRLVLRSPITGEDRITLTSSAPLQDPDGSITGAVAVIQDISALAELERQRDRMVATVAHDLRNPLTSISGMSQLLQLRTSRVEACERDRFVHGLQTIETAARRMTLQINELLDYAQVRTGRPIELALEPTDVVGLLRGILVEHQHTTDEHTLELRAAEDPIVALVDPLRLQRAITNLLVNAIKYSPNGGRIVVSVAKAVGPDGPWLSIDVTDNGMGIPAADLPYMFEQYRRASNVATMPGTGLGLAGVRHTIVRHGGTVGIDSTEGVGTTVSIRLPMQGHAGSASAEGHVHTG